MIKKLLYCFSVYLLFVSSLVSASSVFINPSLNYNVNSNSDSSDINIGGSTKLGYQFTDSISLQVGTGSYGRDSNRKNIYLSTLGASYDYLISERYDLYFGLGGYQYRSNVDFLLSFGMKMNLDEDLILKVGYEFFNNLFTEHDVYSFSVGFIYVF